MSLDRRSTLKLIGGALGAPMLYACDGDRPTRPLTDVIDTVVLLMMENRSFDHYYGALSLEEGRTNVDGLTSRMFNPSTAGALLPARPADQFCIDDPPHGWNASRRQFNEGRNDGFVREYERRHGVGASDHPLGYFDRRTLPAHYNLGTHYTICERWFASLMTSTWPNRFYTLAAQNNGIRNNAFDGDYSFPNIYDRLGQAGVPWSVYYGNISFSLLFPRQYPAGNFKEFMQFFDDAAAGTLPRFVMLEPIYGRNDDHPPAHPIAGQVLIQSVYDALAKSPQWGRSLLIVTYDEHGGFYDHVPPPLAADERSAEGFDQLGFRVPAFVAGPYVKTNHIERTVFDHTSVLALLERMWGLRSLTSRDASAADLRVVLDEARIRDAAPAAPMSWPTIQADERAVYAPECVAGVPGFGRTLETYGQLELAAFVHQNYAGTSLDRRAKTDDVYETFLRHAERRGVLRRTI